ncbi:ABC transporter substrate-binding protein [Effusibacillus dendaii]|uniref:Thiamine pyrimidine synthase n=1 Tax=Effusibacillus dendaii TaxID=2743772 RepID=A0A7I8DD23_9BACL|nr:ABC transporter substrate-binding protein [Effusibacillus dendaii]BCJ85791.1 ABC transporter substrate-binding protein [Effusibacillus dendaii]
MSNITNRKRGILFSVLLSIPFLLTACGGTSSNTAKPESVSKTKNVMVTEAFHSLLYLPLYVGNKQGFFDQNGIHITSIRAAGSGPTALASVLSGEAQFSVHGPEHVAFARDKGGDARAVSAVANSAPVWILAKEGVKIDSARDFRGKKIVVGLAPGTSNTLLKLLLSKNNIDLKDVTITEVQNGSELGPVLAGQADIAVAYEPQVDQGVAQGLKIVYQFTNDYPDYAFSTVNTSQALIEKDPDLVKKFVLSVQESLDYMHKDPDKAKEIARKEFPDLSPDVVNQAVQRMIDSNVYPKTSLVNEAAFKNAMDVQTFVGNLKKDVSYTDIVNPSFAK